MSISVATALGMNTPAPMPVMALKAMKGPLEVQKPLMREQTAKMARPMRVRRWWP